MGYQGCGTLKTGRIKVPQSLLSFTRQFIKSTFKKCFLAHKYHDDAHQRILPMKRGLEQSKWCLPELLLNSSNLNRRPELNRFYEVISGKKKIKNFCCSWRLWGNLNKLLTLCQQFDFTFLDSIKINFKEKLDQNAWWMEGNKNYCSAVQKRLNKSNFSHALHSTCVC